MDIVLASASPRRQEMLRQIGIPFTVRVSDVEERIDSSDPETLCRSLSLQKAEAVAELLRAEAAGPFCVIGADTVVASRGEILGKPADEADALRMVRLLSGHTHQVFTGVTVIAREKENGLSLRRSTFSDRTDVTVCPIPEADALSYVKTAEPYDKAGGYAIQGFFGRYITRIDGDYNNVKGLPVGRLYREYLAELLSPAGDGRAL